MDGGADGLILDNLKIGNPPYSAGTRMDARTDFARQEPGLARSKPADPPSTTLG